MLKKIKSFFSPKQVPAPKVDEKVEIVNAAPYKIEAPVAAPVEVPTVTAVVEGAGVVEVPAKKSAPKAKAPAKAPAKKTEVKKAPVKKAPIKKPVAKAKPAAAKPAKKSAK